MEGKVPSYELFDEFRAEALLNISQLKIELNRAKIQINELNPAFSKEAKKRKNTELLAEIQNEKEFYDNIQKKWNFEGKRDYKKFG